MFSHFVRVSKKIAKRNDAFKYINDIESNKLKFKSILVLSKSRERERERETSLTYTINL